jgi:homoserine kinase type II
MALITPLSDEEMRRVLAFYSLALESFTPLPGKGTVNTNFEVRASGRRYFLRVNEGKSAADALAEGRLVAALRRGGVPTPEVLTAPGGAHVEAGGKPVTLFPWIDGHEAHAAADEPATVAVVGRALALVHQAGRALAPAELPRNHYSLEELERRLATFDGDPRFADVVPLIAAELARAHRRRRESAPGGLIHQDLFPDNLLVDERGELAAILDLEQATGGPFAYDLAVSLNAWCWDGREIRREAADAVLAAYERARPLEAAARAALVDEARLAAARFTITRITDVFLPDGVDEDLRRRKDYREYTRRLAYWLRAA